MKPNGADQGEVVHGEPVERGGVALLLGGGPAPSELEDGVLTVMMNAL